MAVSSAFAGAKLETILLSNAAAAASSSPSQFHQIGVFCKPRKTLIQRGLNSVRCEIQTTDTVDTNRVASSSSLSAFEQLKTSTADSNFSLLGFC